MAPRSVTFRSLALLALVSLVALCAADMAAAATDEHDADDGCGTLLCDTGTGCASPSATLPLYPAAVLPIVALLETTFEVHAVETAAAPAIQPILPVPPLGPRSPPRA